MQAAHVQAAATTTGSHLGGLPARFADVQQCAVRTLHTQLAVDAWEQVDAVENLVAQVPQLTSHVLEHTLQLEDVS